MVRVYTALLITLPLTLPLDLSLSEENSQRGSGRAGLPYRGFTSCKYHRTNVSPKNIQVSAPNAR